MPLRVVIFNSGNEGSTCAAWRLCGNHRRQIPLNDGFPAKPPSRKEI